MDQTDLLENMIEFKNKSRPKEEKDKKRDTFDSVSTLCECRELNLNAFRNDIVPIIEKKGKRLKILTLKQMLQRLPVALAQVKADSTSTTSSR